MNVLLGVTGCIGAYKSALILRLLQKQGIDVEVVMTSSAQAFIGPLTLEKLSGRRVLSDVVDSGETEISHIAAARRNDLLLVAPATANILAKFARGIADDLLSTVYLSTTRPVVVAPAMNVEMWKHPATRANVAELEQRGVVVVPPGSGYQACGEVGEGRLAEPEEIIDVVRDLLAAGGSLEGVRVLVTAGPTIEDLDPVRFLSNRSSGRMGYAMAGEAARRGAAVVLVSGPSRLTPPSGVEVVRVRSAAQMAEAVLDRAGEVDVVVKAAAVADYTPAERSAAKIAKSDDDLTVRLTRTPDILEQLSELGGERFVVGFAAESSELEQRAAAKLARKQLDLIVANDITADDAGFAAETNRAVLLDPAGGRQQLSLMGKAEMAGRIWDRIETLRAGASRKPRTAPATEGSTG